MTWTKLSDDFGEDCWTLSDAAFRMHVEGLGWSNRKLLDCRIPKGEVRRFAKDPASVAELLEAGYWTAEGEHYIIRHHAGYQRSREAVLKQQANSHANGRKGGRPPRGQKPDPEPDPKTQKQTQKQTHEQTQNGTQWVSAQNRETLDTPSFPQVETQQLTQSKTQRDGTGTDKGKSTYITNREQSDKDAAVASFLADAGMLHDRRSA